MNEKERLEIFSRGWVYGYTHGIGKLTETFDFSDCKHYEEMIEKMFKRNEKIMKNGDSWRGL